jgi:hypothetical protein
MSELVKPHILFQILSPDQVAECLDDVPVETYTRLWNLVRHYEGQPRSECNDDFDERCLANWWHELPEKDHVILNHLAKLDDKCRGGA